MDYIAEKLGNPSAEVRGRALESLEFKWKYGLVRSEDLIQDRRVLRGLLGLLGLGDGPQTTAVALLLLRKMAATDTRLARALLELGVLQQLQATPIRPAPSSSQAAEPFIWIQPGFWPEEILPSVEALAKLLLGFEPHTSLRPAGLHSSSDLDAAAAAAAAAAEAVAQGAQGTGDSLGQHQPLLQAAALRRLTASAASAGLGSDAAGSPPLAHAHLSSGSLGSAGLASPGAAQLADTAASAPSAAGGARSSLCDSVGGHYRSASMGNVQGSSAATAAATGGGADGGAGMYHQGGAAGPGSAAASGDTALFDERLLRARARADWRQMEAAGSSCGLGIPLYPSDSSSSRGPPAGHLTLPVVSLSAADDQVLFELNVRLQYSDDERLLLPALLELAGAVGLDMPAEALLTRPSLLDNCLALVGSSKASRAVQQAACAALLQLVKGLKQSVRMYQSTELARSEYGDAATAAAAAAAKGKPITTDFASCLPPYASASGLAMGGGFTGHSAGFMDAAKALAAAQAPVLDPSCPNSYPQLMLPDLGADAVWRLPAGALQGAEVDVTAVVVSICLQTTELLKHPERHYELLPLLEEALPLLAAPLRHLRTADTQLVDTQQQQGTQFSGDQQQQLEQHMQAVWRGLLAALSRALAASAAVGAADRAAAASAGLAGGSSELTATVAAAVPPAAAGGVAALAAGSGGDGGLCVWDLPTINLLLLGLTWIRAAPPSWVTPSLVPASLADTVAAAACDEALHLVLPQLRQAAHNMLQHLRPGALQALREAHAVPAAWPAGEEALRQLNTLQQQLATLQCIGQQEQEQQLHEVQSAVAGWLHGLQGALPGLGYAPRWDAKLLQGALHGLSLIAAAGSHSSSSTVQGGASTLQRVGGLVVTLLRHHSPSVQQRVRQLLQSAVSSSSAAAAAAEHNQRAAQSPAVTLLLLPCVLECLIVEQLSSSEAKPAACRLLMGLLQQGGSSAQHLLPWRPWISSCTGDTAGDALDAALSEFLSQGLGQSEPALGQEQDQQGFWAGGMVVLLQDLFSVSGEVRRRAGRQLLQVMTAGADMTAEELEEYTDDPFKGLLSNTHAAGSSHPASAPSSGGGGGSGRFLLPPDPLTDASASMAATFSRQDVTNLLAVLANKGLAQELRRSAAEELLALSPEPHLLEVMVQQQHLHAIWQLCVPPGYDDDEGPGSDPLRGLGLSSLAVGAGDPSGSIFDMQLPIAGLQLLAGLLARSAQAMDWLGLQPDRLLQPLLPLVLHSLNSVRKAVGRVLALVVFGHAAQQWSGFAQAARAAAGAPNWQEQHQQRMALLPPGAEGVLLPQPFRQRFKLPFKVTWLPVEAVSHSAATEDAAAGLPGTDDEVGVQASQQQRQRALVRQLVEQQQILCAATDAAAAGGSSCDAAGVAASARSLLADCLPVGLSHIGQRVSAATAANLVLIDPAAVAARCLAAVAAAASHAECTQALSALQQQLGGTSWGLMAVLQNPSPGWLTSLSRLLGTAPVTREDQQLWLLVLQLTERLLVAAGDQQGASVACTVAAYTQLQLLLQASVSVWLQQPAAAAAAPRPPLALAAGSSGWEAMRAQPSSAATASAVADALGLSGSSGAAATAGSGSSDTTLAVILSRQALRTLWVLVKAVKRDCSFSIGFYQQQQQKPSRLLDAANGSSSAAMACYSLSALKPADLIWLLTDCVIGVTEGVDYGCRVLASAVVCEALGAVQDAACAQPASAPTAAPAGAGNASGSQQAATRLLPAAGQGATGVPCAVLHLLEAWICRVLMPVSGRQLPGFTGKALVRSALQGLGSVVQGPLVCEQEWMDTWADIGGTFWLSRLCRDREAFIRQLALSLAAQLLHPGRAPTQALITSNWPDCVHRLLRASSDVCEAHGVRAAALRGLAAAMVLPLDALQQLSLPQQQRQAEVPALPSSSTQHTLQQQEREAAAPAQGEAGLTQPHTAGTAAAAAAAVAGPGAAQQVVQTAPARVKNLHGFGLAPLLQAELVWQQLLPQLLLKWQQQPSSLTAAAAVLAAVAAAAQPDGVGRQLLLSPGAAAAAVGIAAAAAGADDSVNQVQVTASSDAAAALQQQCDSLDAAAAALQLLALGSAPASSGGGLLPLPASFQTLSRAGPAVAMRLMCSIGHSLHAQQQAVGQSLLDRSTSGKQRVVGAGGAGTHLRLQQQQLTAFRVAAATLAAAAGAWPEATRRQHLLPLLQVHSQAGSFASGSSGCCQPGELVCAVAAVLAHPACCSALRSMCTQLLGLLLSDPRLAQAVLAGSTTPTGTTPAAVKAEADAGTAPGPIRQAEAVFPGSSSSSSGNEEAIGAVLCRDLAGQLPSSIFLPSTLTDTSAAQVTPVAAAASRNVNSSVSAILGTTPAWAAAAAAEPTGQLMVAAPEGLVVVFALQNLLGFSRPAKAAALGIGLHKLLMEAALSMAAAVAGPAAAVTTGGSNAAGARRTRARWFNTATAAPTASAGAAGTAVMAGPSRKGNTGSVAFGRGGGPDLPSFTAVAGVKRPTATSAAAAAAGSGGGGTPPSDKGKSGGAGASSRRGSLSLRSSSAMKAKQQQEEQQQEQVQPVQQEQYLQQQQPTAEMQRPVQVEGQQPVQQQQQEGAGNIQPPQQQQVVLKEVPAASDACQHVSLLQQQLRQQHDSSEQAGTGSPGTAAAAAAAAETTAAAAAGVVESPGRASGFSKQQLQAACKQLNLRKLLMSVVLLRHLAAGCEDTQAALTADGVVDVVLKLWPLALQHTPLLLELTRLLANSLPSCYEARLAAATLSGPACSPVCAGTALSCVMSLLVGQQLTPQLQQAPAAAAPAAGSSVFAAAAGTAAVVRAAAVVLLGYGSTEDGAATLVKAGASCLPELAKAVRGCIVSARRESETQLHRQLNSERLAAVLQLLAVLAGRPEGQRAMLRLTVAPVILELCAEVLQLPQQQAAVAAALLLVRNLSFNQDVRTPLLANAALLPLLLGAAECLLAALPAAERQQWQQRLTAADQELAAAAAELGCDCKPPKWDPMYEALGPGGGAGQAGGARAAAAKLAAGSSGSSSRPGSPLLLGAGGAAVPGAAGNVCCAVYAVSALWALVHNGEKVKAALRKLPAAAARLGMVRAYAAQLLVQPQLTGEAAAGAGAGTAPAGAARPGLAGGSGQLQAQRGSRLRAQRPQQEPVPAATPAAARGGGPDGQGLVGVEGVSKVQQQGPVWGEVWVGSGSLCGAQGADWWLQQLQDSCGALLDLMDAC